MGQVPEVQKTKKNAGVLKEKGESKLTVVDADDEEVGMHCVACREPGSAGFRV